MHFNLALITAALAGAATAMPGASSSSAHVSGTPSSSSMAMPSKTPNPADHDCIIANRGCDWTKSVYGYGSDYCGSSPYKPFQQLSDGGIVLAVAKNGGFEDGCLNQTTFECCKALSKDPCSRGEKYLECSKP